MEDRDALTGYEMAMPWAAETARPGTQLRLDAAPEERCSECRAPIDDGEGYDGKCGPCADVDPTITLDMPTDEFIARLEKAPGVCRWFLLCDRAAVTTVAHPILGDVPTCQRCHDRAT